MSRHVAWKELLSRMVTRANVGKSRERIAASIEAMRSGTRVSTRAGNRPDVRTVACIPAVLLMSFCAALATRMRARRSGQ